MDENRKMKSKYLKYKNKYLKMKSMLSQTGGDDKEWDEYNNKIYEILKKKDNLRVVFGAGNKNDNHLKMFDADKFSGNQYDLGVTHYDGVVNKDGNDPYAIKANFNERKMLTDFANHLKGKVSKLIFDVSTTKSLFWTIDDIKYIFAAMKEYGKLYIDLSIYSRHGIAPDKVTGKVKFPDSFMDGTFSNNDPGIHYDKEVQEHNANLFRKAGFNVEIVNVTSAANAYPVSNKKFSIVPTYAIATKPKGGAIAEQKQSFADIKEQARKEALATIDKFNEEIKKNKANVEELKKTIEFFKEQEMPYDQITQQVMGLEKQSREYETAIQRLTMTLGIAG